MSAFCKPPFRLSSVVTSAFLSKVAGSILLCSLSASALAKVVSVASPDGKIRVSVSDETPYPTYDVSFAAEQVIDQAKLGLVFKKLPEFGPGPLCQDSCHC